MYLFGSGFLYGTPTADATGAAIANPTPILLGTLQEVSVDFGFEIKLLHGQLQFAVAAGRGKGKVSGKAKVATINAAAYASLIFGGTPTSSIIAAVNNVTGKAIPSTPFTITATTTETATTTQIPSSGTWLADLGVRDQNGNPMTRVASAPTTGQYSVSAGAYVFAAVDVGLIVYISYEYTATSTTAKTFDLTNQQMGYAPTFSAVLSAPFQGKNFHCKLPQCISNKLGISFKNDDFAIPEFDFDCFANAAGLVARFAMTE